MLQEWLFQVPLAHLLRLTLQEKLMANASENSPLTASMLQEEVEEDIMATDRHMHTRRQSMMSVVRVLQITS